MKNGYKKYTCTGAGGFGIILLREDYAGPPGLYSFYVKPFGVGAPGGFAVM